MSAPQLEWGVSRRAFGGDSHCGDHYLVHACREGVLVAVADGLGHGIEASEAAEAVCEALRRDSLLPLDALVRDCHEAVRKTRGAVLSLALFHANIDELSWLGVGNVEGRLRSGNDLNGSSQSLLLRPGVIGYRLPPLRVNTLPVHAGDTLVMVSDGLRLQCFEAMNQNLPPQALAELLVDRYGRDSDDALALVVRYQGAA